MAMITHSLKSLGLTTALAASAFAFSGSASAAPLPSGWTCTGNCGTTAPVGQVAASPQGGNYGYVASNSGVTGQGLPGFGGTDGSRARSSLFSANAGDELEFFFQYLTSDGAGFSDYAWVRLLDNALAEVAILFTARTTPTGDTVPGFGLPGLAPGVVLTPPSTPIIPNETTWPVIGSYSGSCFSTGCGRTGWIEMAYTIAAAGSYYLEFGVVDNIDQIYDSGLAFDGILVAGVPIDPDGEIPEPASLALLGIGALGLAAARRRRKFA